MSGADVISNIAILLFISSIMSLIYLSFMYVANKSIGDIGRHILLPNDVAKDAYPLVLIAVSLFVYFGNLYYNFGINVFGSKFESVNFNSSLFLESNWFIIQSSVVSVIFYSMIVDFRTPIFIKFKTALNSLYSIMFILGAIVLSHIFNHAVFLRPDWYVFGPNVDCKVNATAAWIGSESVVVVCGNSNRRVVESDNFSVLPREGLTFKKIPEKKNDAQTH